MAKIKTVNKTTTIVVDKETGEVLETAVNNVKMIVDNEEFMLVYVGFWNAIRGNKLSKSDIDLLAFLIEHYCDGTPFGISKYIKEKVAKQTGKSITTYNNCTRVLVDENFIIEVGTKTYVVNPAYAFKGSSNKRNKAIIELTNF